MTSSGVPIPEPIQSAKLGPDSGAESGAEVENGVSGAKVENGAGEEVSGLSGQMYCVHHNFGVIESRGQRGGKLGVAQLDKSYTGQGWPGAYSSQDLQ